MSTERTEKSTATPEQPTEVPMSTMISEDSTIDFHYLKGVQARTIHVDGAYGGLTPRGNMICMTVFSERWPIPTQTASKVAEGKAGPEIPERRVTRKGIIREIEANLVFDIGTAEQIIAWLARRIEQAKSQNQEGAE